jgi:hypothetical protein
MLIAVLLLQAAAAAPTPAVLSAIPKHDELVYTFGGVPRERA